LPFGDGDGSRKLRLFAVKKVWDWIRIIRVCRQRETGFETAAIKKRDLKHDYTTV
jgi:hypothetical protein